MERITDPSGTIFKIKRFCVHDGPGIRTSVFLKGCPLNCIWCHSPEGISSSITIWHDKSLCIACGECVDACPERALNLEPDIIINRNLCTTSGDCVRVCPTGAIQFTGSITRASDIVKEIKKDLKFYVISGGGVTLTGGEPLYQPDFSKAILSGCRSLNIHTAIETSLFCDPETVSRFLELADLFIVDMKIIDDKQHIRFTGKSNDVIKENLKFIVKSGKEVVVRVPMIPKITDNSENKKAIEHFVHAINPKIPIEYISFNPLAENNYKRLGIPFLLKN